MRRLSLATNLILCGLAYPPDMASAESSPRNGERTSRSRLDPDFYRDAPSKSCFTLALNICLGATSAKPPVAGPEIMKRPFK